jgi:site-specific recombinase XerD
MPDVPLLDARGYRRSIATMPGFHSGRPPRNRGRRYPADPPTTEELVRLLAGCGDSPSGERLRALIVLLWRSGLRISEALALEERDLDPGSGSITVRRGKGGRRRIVGMDPWGWTQLKRWNTLRERLAPGPYFCVISGPTSGRPLSASHVRDQLRRLQRRCGIRRRVAPHQLRHCHAVELVREGVPVHLLQRQLGHANLAFTTVYLSSVAPEEVLAIAHQRHQPMVQITNLRG